jgi:hypothetical protein
MRMLFAAMLALPLLAPAGAFAMSAGHQSTGAESDLRLSVKAKHPTHKRHQIIRSELNRNEPNVTR